MRKTMLSIGVAAIVGFASVLSASSPSYRVAGEYFETCTCNAACPCIFGSDPSHHACKASLVWHIREGRSGDVRLDGLSVVVVLISEGNMDRQVGKMRGLLYVDERANPAQRKAIETIYRGQVGPFFAEMPAARYVRIEFGHQGGVYSVHIPEILDAKIEAMQGNAGKAPEISHAPGALLDRLWVGRSVEHRYSDAKLDSWQYSGRSAFYGSFEYPAPAAKQ